ncbi:Butyrophilin-like protein 2 [Anabarilius grahami]|uniref:Butyrophilin-like protein 2 n=1 Tax=Anabarilius grahami TaxID=495550 RepID=A0A3N0Y4E0_ANAGA|nr:Butyrophilin-like protein 2 [Anabarilius grahami]
MRENTHVKFTATKDVECLRVSGSNRSVSAYDGEDVTLNCSVDSHIKPEHIEEVKWIKTDEDILVLLYQNNETFPDSSDEQYRDRVEFTGEIPKGNFSLRLKSVRTEDKGVYMCQVFAGGLSGNAMVVLERLGFSLLHITVLVFCFVSGSGAVLLLYCLIYCRSKNTGVIERKNFLLQERVHSRHNHSNVCPECELRAQNNPQTFIPPMFEQLFSVLFHTE